MRKLACATVLILAARLSAAEPAGDAAAKADALIDKATQFLLKEQQENGTWQKVPKDPPAITALAVHALVKSGKIAAADPKIAKAYQSLIAAQQANGGFYKENRANYGTAITLSALAAANDPAFKPNMEKAIAFLRSLQWNDTVADAPERNQVAATDPRFGGWGYGGGKRPDGSNSQMTIDALVDAGVKPDDPAIQNAVKFFSRMQNNSETNDQPWAGNDGGFVYSPANNGESFAGEFKDAAGNRRVRSYGAMSYAAYKSFVYAGLSKDDPRVKAARKWIADNYTVEFHPGMADLPEADRQWSLYYYYMTFGRALRAAGEPTITDAKGATHDWRVELVDQLAKLQKDDGSFVGVKKWMEDNPIITTSYVLTALEAARDDLKKGDLKKSK